MDDRMKEIHDKGFNMTERPMTEYRNVEGLDFSKIKVGVKSLQDAILDLGSLKKTVDNYMVMRVYYFQVEKRYMRCWQWRKDRDSD